METSHIVRWKNASKDQQKSHKVIWLHKPEWSCQAETLLWKSRRKKQTYCERCSGNILKLMLGGPSSSTMFQMSLGGAKVNSASTIIGSMVTMAQSVVAAHHGSCALQHTGINVRANTMHPMQGTTCAMRTMNHADLGNVCLNRRMHHIC